MTRFLGPVPPPGQPWPLRWPDLEEGPFHARLWFDRVDGVQSVVGVELWSGEPRVEPRTGDQPVGTDAPRVPIRAEDIRLPLGELRDWWVQNQMARVRAARSTREALPEELRLPLDVHEAAVREFEARVVSQHRRPGRPPLSDEFLGQVARIYNEAIENGDRHPTQRVFEFFEASGERRDYKTVQRWISAARKRGIPLLPVPQKKQSKQRRGNDG